MTSPKWVSIGEIAKRTGAAVSAIRFYEEKGLLRAHRSPGGNRMFLKSDFRRVSFILIAQRLGFSLEEIGTRLKGLPNERAPTKADWEKIARGFRIDIDTRISALADLRARLTGCIGCGCLSLKSCAIYNPKDAAYDRGAGPRYLMGDRPENIEDAG